MIEIDVNDIVITEEEVGDYIRDLEMIKQICVQFGADIASLITETNDLNALIALAEKNEEDDAKKFAQLTWLNEILSLYKRAIDEADKAITDLNGNYSRVHIIRASDLSNIRRSISTLFGEYTAALSHVMSQKIINEQFISTIKERLSFILCLDFEHLRARLKCVMTDQSETKTIH